MREVTLDQRQSNIPERLMMFSYIPSYSYKRSFNEPRKVFIIHNRGDYS
jgi:hypothetical protein